MSSPYESQPYRPDPVIEPTRYQPGEQVVWTDGKRAEVQGYTSIRCRTVALKDDTGLQFSVHERELRKLTLDEQVQRLLDTIDTAERDVKGNMGDDAWETGGWVDVTRSMIDLAGPEISDEAKRQVRRMTGLVDVEAGERDDEIRPARRRPRRRLARR
jgi:hypothetical protein